MKRQLLPTPSLALSTRTRISNSANVVASLVGLLIVLIACWIWNQEPNVGMVAAPALTLIVALFVPVSRALAVVTLLNYPYALGAYLGALGGITFYPRPPLSNYAVVAQEQTLSLLIAFGVCLLLGIAQLFHQAAVRGWKQFHAYAAGGVEGNTRRLMLVLSIACIVGLHDAAFLLGNLGSILNSGRHTFTKEFWVGNGPFGIVLALVVGIVLISAVFSNRKYRWISIVVLLIFWAPTLVAGSRNYFSVLVVGALYAAFLALKNGRSRAIVGALSAVGAIGFSLLPTLWTTNDLVGFNEWILPTSSYLPLALGLFTVEGIGATPMADQWALLLPGPLRPFPVNLYAEVFAEGKFTNVGVAGNPWADAYDQDGFLRTAVFVMTFVFIFLLAVVLRKVHPLLPFLAFGLMAFWGRSVFWNVAVVLVYAALMLRICIPVKEIRKM